MESLPESFHLIDLASQAETVQSLLAGRSMQERIAWFEARGTLSPTTANFGGDSPMFVFESVQGIRCGFFFKGESIVFVGDNTLWSVPRKAAEPHRLPVRRSWVRRSCSVIAKWLAGGDQA